MEVLLDAGATVSSVIRLYLPQTTTSIDSANASQTLVISFNLCCPFNLYGTVPTFQTLLDQTRLSKCKTRLNLLKRVL